MSIVENIFLSNLLLDVDNPRLDNSSSQREAISAMIRAQGPKLVNLAKDIIDNGINPSELVMVMPTEDDKKRYIVLEGNRRVTALKALSTPDLASNALDNTNLNRLKKLSGKFLEYPIDSLLCVVVESKEEAHHWITLKHTGENSGAGLVGWGALESERYIARRGKKSPRLQVLDFVKQHGKLSASVKSKIDDIDISSLERLISDPYFRERVGLDIQQQTVYTKYPNKEVLKGLTKVVEDFALKRKNVNDIRHKADRIKYVDSFKKSEIPNPKTEISDSRVLGEASEVKPITETPPRKRSKPPSRIRTTLIPKNCIMEIDNTRINEIYIELKQLNVHQYPNAAAIMFRVFIELSMDEYISKESIRVDERAKLRDKINAVADKLKGKNLMDDKQLQPARRAVSGQDLLASSIQTMHAYVHNRFFTPTPDTLKIAWDDLQPFVETVYK